MLFAEHDAAGARFAAEAARIRHRQSDLMLELMAETTATTPSHEGRERLEAMTLALAGAYESLSLWWREHPEVAPEQLADWLLDLLWPGLERLMTQLASTNPPASNREDRIVPAIDRRHHAAARSRA